MPPILRLAALLMLAAAPAAAQSVAWPDSLAGGPVPPAEVPALHAVTAAVRADRIEADVRTLAAFGTRHTMSDTTSDTRGIGAARRWFRAQLDAISRDCGGCLEVVEQRTLVSGERRIPTPTVVVNVYAVQRGTADPNRYVVMSGDIDSRASDVMDFTSDAPGANDNATGLAGVLEAARVLSTRRFAGSIVYAGLSAEEQGLFGGQALAERAKTDGWRIEAFLNNDMIGNSCGITGICDNTTARVFSEGTRADETPEMARTRRFTGGEDDSPARNLARYIDRMADGYIRNLDVRMVYRLDRFGRGGHHAPFSDAGFPAVRIMETNEHYDRQHQDVRTENGRQYGDTVEFIDWDYAATLTALNAVVLAGLAGAPGPPHDVRVEGAVQPSATLRWTPPPDAAASRVWWRLTTEPTWTYSVTVPRSATAYTLENVVVDDFFFGVSSVAADGSESAVVFPGPIGAIE